MRQVCSFQEAVLLLEDKAGVAVTAAARKLAEACEAAPAVISFTSGTSEVEVLASGPVGMPRHKQRYAVEIRVA